MLPNKEVIALTKHYGPLIRCLHISTSHAITAAMEECGLTASQGHTLKYLSMCQEPPCPRDIEEVFHLSHPTVSGLLTRLEKKQFIELRPDSKDRRYKRVYLLPKGREVHQRILQIIDETEARLVTGFTQEEQREFMDFLERAIENMGQSAPDFLKEEENQ